MTNLETKILALEELLKALKLAPIKPKITQGTPNTGLKGPRGSYQTTPTSPKIPGIKPPSGKDPTKVAAQIQGDPGLKNAQMKEAKEVLAVARNGQWKLGKIDDEE